MNLQAWIIAKKVTLFFQLLGCLNVGFQKKKRKKEWWRVLLQQQNNAMLLSVERGSEARERVHGDGVSDDIAREGAW